ncbi:glucose 1-dehydrogenase [Arenibaculum sp.]|uniref:SDR family NAD(P)-dependent oxidoreductase n=1 Tax=Arenibaculum sp. TaxID=2865862 RepID=UPI002E14A6EF|nr:glucose 1-dehydrogenase [Arenibaculum sp.]
MGTRFEHRVAVVTGGAGGIGRVIAERLAAEGAATVVADLDGKAAADRAARIGGRVLGLQVDVTDAASVETMMSAVDALGVPDILVNAAGIARDVPFLETDPALARRMLDVNLMGTFLCGQAAARRMAAAGGGCIVNIASVSGQRGNAGRAAYGASKGAVIVLTRVMALELAPHGIRVNAVAPGPVETPMVAAMHTTGSRERWLEEIPMRRYASAEEIAGPVLFLASTEASYVTGHVLNVDGGFQAAGLRAAP